jgi:hypothetical protein
VGRGMKFMPDKNHLGVSVLSQVYINLSSHLIGWNLSYVRLHSGNLNTPKCFHSLRKYS